MDNFPADNFGNDMSNFGMDPTNPPYSASPVAPSNSIIWIILILVLIGVGLFVYFRMSGLPNITTLLPSSQKPQTISPSTTPAQTTTYPVPETSQIPVSEVCQAMSDEFGIRPNNEAYALGAPAIIETWEKNECQNVPSTWSCQHISDAFNVGPKTLSNNPGYWAYHNQKCTTSPQITCQTISDQYFTRPGFWGNIDPGIMMDVNGDVLRDSWRNRNCQTIPKKLTCQDISNIYNMSATSAGIAPPSVFGTFRTKGCRSTPMTCQYISDVYNVGGTNATFLQPSADIGYADIAWSNQKCSTDAPPQGYITSLKDQRFKTGDVGYSSTNLRSCLQECTTDSLCDLVEYNTSTQTCENKVNVDFDRVDKTENAPGIVVFRKRDSS